MRNDLRRSFRIQTPEGQQRGVFRLGKHSYPVLILNTSADGFAFLSAQPISVSSGTIACLYAGEAWSEVLVVRTEATADGFLIGVERLGDIKDPDHRSAPERWPRSKETDARSAVSTAIALVGVALCVVLSGYLIAGRPTLESLRRSLLRQSASHVPESQSWEVEAPLEAAMQPMVPQSLHLVETLPVVHGVDESSVLDRQHRLLRDDVAAELHLTAMQRQDIRRLFDRRDEQLREGGDAWEIARQTEAKLLQILTPRQVTTWRDQPLP